MSEPRFTVNQKVRLRAQSERVGLVTSVVQYDGGWAYRVFFSVSDQPQVNESSLEAVQEVVDAAHIVSRDQFLRDLLLTKLNSPLSDVLYAYQASRTKYEAYQFKPVLKFLDSPVPGILIADEVGLGKTIEAAILLQELRARANIRRVLVICPAGLREKWQAELLQRFSEQFQQMYRPQIEEDLRLYRQTEGHNTLNGIVSLETFRSQEIQERLIDAGVTYDVVIIDEAHHLRTTGTLSQEVGERMQEASEHLILLTATPLQTGHSDLFNLLRFLDPGQFDRLDDFILQLQPNALLNEAITALRRQPPDVAEARSAMSRIPGLDAGSQVTNHPAYPIVMRTLKRPVESREALVRLRREIDSLNVISSIYTRTIKKDVSNAAERSAHVVKVDVTEAEARFLEAVLRHARAKAMRRSPTGWTPGFVGVQSERQAASCIAATREYLEERLRARADGTAPPTLGVEESSTDFGVDEGDDEPGHRTADDVFDVERSERELVAAAIALGSVDSKFERFIATLDGVLAENEHSKVIVFMFFRRTIAYLERQLRARGIQVEVIHGGVSPEDRARRIDRFRESATMRVLLTTEVGSEGLDFQFCDTMFNYDLPWNPMRVEQRIGRIDRYGQRSRRVRIFSFFLQGTVEERILERLYDRIGIFQQSIGELEPILGPIISELTRDVFRADLSPEEEVRVAERFAQMIVQRREIEAELERSSSKFMGQDALLLQAIEDGVSSGRFVSAAELRAIVSGYLEDQLGIGLIDRAGDGQTVLIPSDGKLTARLAEHLQQVGDNRQGSAEFLAKANRAPRIAATFEGDVALSRGSLELLNIRHPLVRMAVDHFNKRHASRASAYPFTCLRIDVDRLHAEEGPWPPAGSHRFLLLRLTVSGAHDQVRLLPVAFDMATGQRATLVEDRILRLIQEFAEDDVGVDISIDEREALEDVGMRVAAAIADQVQAAAIERNEASIAVRRATLERTFGHRIEKRRKLLASATNESIQRMRRSEIANLQADLERRVQELESRRDVSVGLVPVGAGRLVITSRATPPGPTQEPAVEVAPMDVPSYDEPPQVFRA